jgi:hypothetical protein
MHERRWSDGGAASVATKRGAMTPRENETMKCWKQIDDVPESVLEEYRSGKWSCEPPPVCSALWGELSWINHIYAGRRCHDCGGRLMVGGWCEACLADEARVNHS